MKNAANSLAVVREADRKRAVQVKRAIYEDLRPGGIVIAAELGNHIARGEAGACSGGAGGHIVDHGGTIQVLVDLVVEHTHPDEQDE